MTQIRRSESLKLEICRQDTGPKAVSAIMTLSWAAAVIMVFVHQSEIRQARKKLDVRKAL